ncbi:hypothetical protein HPB48_020884 [Haemaphysalis longicornis]|uniref:C2H2-type domain-containing protein n=1 Tax=Haemaphysalis longicornis TaxID=44386 RepID=A0A9J6FVA5_HAELO|nr:hypothetical protein HPB48_020884 [Haemaphysalis longicornis]
MAAEVLGATKDSVVVIKQENIDEHAYTSMLWGYIDEGDASTDGPADDADTPEESSQEDSGFHGECPPEPVSSLVAVKPFPCDQCPMAFDSAAQIKRHHLAGTQPGGGQRVSRVPQEVPVRLLAQEARAHAQRRRVLRVRRVRQAVPLQERGGAAQASALRREAVPVSNVPQYVHQFREHDRPHPHPHGGETISVPGVWESLLNVGQAAATLWLAL